MTSSPEELPISDATYGGQITYLTKRGRRVGAIVPVEVAEAAEHAEGAYPSRLARDAEAELATGAPTRALAEVIADLDLGRPDDHTDEATPRAMPEQRGEPSAFAPEAEPHRRS